MPKAGFTWKNMVDRETFYDSINQYCFGHERITQKQAADMCGISVPTWIKFANKVIYGEPIPDTFFKAKKKDGQS